MKLKYFVLLLAFACFRSEAGVKEVGNGGNGNAAEFVQLASYGVDILTRQGGTVIGSRSIDLAALGRSLLGVKIEFTTSPLVLNGALVHAINYPSARLIVVNATDWNMFNDGTKMQLAFHELWGVTFNDHGDDHYYFSSAMALQIRQAGLTNPNRVISLVTDNQNGRGQTFRAIVVRQGGQDRSNLSLVFQKLQEMSPTLDVVTSYVVFNPNELPFGADSVVENLRRSNLDEDVAFMFEVEPMSTVAPRLICAFVLPEPPASEELSKKPLKCVPFNK